MYRPTSVVALILAVGLVSAACGDNDTPTGPTPDAPAEITQTFSGTLTRNGAATHTFLVQRAGTVTARVTAIPSDAVFGLSIGPLSAQACSQTVANDAATNGTTIIGTASSAGNFCVRIFDAAGQLEAPVAYTLSVTHF